MEVKIQMNTHSDNKIFTKKIVAKMVEEAERIKHHELTEIVKYPQYKEAFDYVHNNFPSANIKNKIVYLCDKEFLEELGYTEIVGFYNNVVDIIVILKNSEYYSISEDEAIVHELLHSVAADNKDEKFAYTESILYFLQKGRDREYIIKYMRPYLNKEIEQIKDTLVDKYKVILEKELKEAINKKINKIIPMSW